MIRFRYEGPSARPGEQAGYMVEHIKKIQGIELT
jgi:hypothetical protein